MSTLKIDLAIRHKTSPGCQSFGLLIDDYTNIGVDSSEGYFKGTVPTLVPAKRHASRNGPNELTKRRIVQNQRGGIEAVTAIREKPNEKGKEKGKGKEKEKGKRKKVRRVPTSEDECGDVVTNDPVDMLGRITDMEGREAKRKVASLKRSEKETPNLPWMGQLLQHKNGVVTTERGYPDKLTQNVLEGDMAYEVRYTLSGESDDSSSDSESNSDSESSLN